MGDYKISISVVGACIILSFVRPTYAVTPEWVRQIGTPQVDRSNAISVDVLGNVFVAGYTSGSLNVQSQGNADAFISKYNSAGELAWTRQIGSAGSDSATGVSGDGFGNVYITGSTGGSLGGQNQGSSDVFLSKFNTDGELLWLQQFGSSSPDFSTGISADSSGNVFVTGGTFGGNLGRPCLGSGDAFVALYNAAGERQWIRQFGGTLQDDGYGISTDGMGNVYVVSDSDVPRPPPLTVSSKSLLQKFDISGNVIWEREVGLRSVAVSANAAGDVFLVGGTFGDVGGTHAGSGDAFVSKYSSSGVFSWSRQLGTASEEASLAVAADKQGNVSIAGYTFGLLGETNAGIDDAFAAKFDAEGNQVWNLQLGTPAADRSQGISVDTSGNVYFSGFTNGSIASANLGNADVFVVKVSSSPSSRSGDFTRDGVVDAADYVGWRNVDGSLIGYSIWRGNFGQILASDTNAEDNVIIPEPNICTLVFSATVIACCLRGLRKI